MKYLPLMPHNGKHSPVMIAFPQTQISVRLRIGLSILVMFILSFAIVVSSASSVEMPRTAVKVNGLLPQNIRVSSEAESQTVVRDSYTVTSMTADEKKASAQAYAQTLVTDPAQYQCLYNLWNRESGWRFDAENVSSGAYGIPQSLPGDKMAQMGDDWRTNWVTQINWGVWYIQHSSYGTPCAAWQHSEEFNWY